ncbi:MAG TPA: hypothetical protein VM690_04910 [Gaiellaceae bacterium]|nr:hypothetical protein [Gaiellaceae bacterium]
MALVEQWNRIESGLDPRWNDLTLELALDDETQAERASALLGPAGPGRSGATIRFFASRDGNGVGPEAVRRLLRRIDGEGIAGTLALDASSDAVPTTPVARETLAAGWDAALTQLPADWSDLLCELELTSSDHLDPAALLLGPINPLGAADTLAYRFRVANTFGYGASAGMVRRCLARLDDACIPGEVRVLRVLSDTHPVGTQGPVWYVGGKAV